MPHADQIDLFLTGQLSPEATAEMEAAIQQDAALAQAVTLRQMEFETAETIIANNLRAQMQQFRNEKMPESENQPWWFSPWLWLILLVVILAGLSLFAWLKPSTPPDKPAILTPPDSTGSVTLQPIQDTTQQTLNTTPPQPVSSGRAYAALATNAYKFDDSGLRGNNEPDFDAMLEAWDQKKYPLVIELFDALPNNHSDRIRAVELGAHAAFRSGQYPLASRLFRQMIQQGSPYDKQGEWYLILSELKQNNLLTASINRISLDADHEHQADAKLLKQALAQLPR